MSTDHTMNYALNQWEGTDKVLRTEFNADNSKIDAALKANADAIAAEAAAREVGDGALENALAGKGNCRIAYGTYTGNGSYGTGHPTALTFPFEPKLLFIQNQRGMGLEFTGASQFYLASMALIRPSRRLCFNGELNKVDVTWSGNTVSWTCDDDAALQFNEDGDVNLYVALG